MESQKLAQRLLLLAVDLVGVDGALRLQDGELAVGVARRGRRDVARRLGDAAGLVWVLLVGCSRCGVAAGALCVCRARRARVDGLHGRGFCRGCGLGAPRLVRGRVHWQRVCLCVGVGVGLFFSNSEGRLQLTNPTSLRANKTWPPCALYTGSLDNSQSACAFPFAPAPSDLAKWPWSLRMRFAWLWTIKP